MSFGAPRPRPGAAAAQGQGGRPPAAHQLPGGGVPRPRRLQYTGVTRGPSGDGWMARVLVDPERGSCRTIGPFSDPHAAALVHDRVAIAYLGDRARPNFPAAFHPIEQRFLRLCREREGQIDVCALVADPGMYEARYATFLRSVLRLKQWGEFKGLIVEFFISRASEIGDDILKEGGEKLEARFVEMHRNKAVDPQWRASYIRRVLQEQQNQQRQQQLQLQLQLQHKVTAAAVQPQQQRWGGSATAVPM
ncbi:unnamed protein product [Miscanthus lutarioriparius]|uniref:AP2/ERF domain-containing protein n=1 Tax=Miscanthus lutarioriparius TaxID=422564 RepID=A0A811MAP0_9POAL|nr:unnamed protein product [Miscanthus lutarioriparius]